MTEVVRKPQTVKEVLEAMGLNPTVEIVKLLAHGELSDKDRIKALETLLQYCEPKLASKQVQVSGEIRHSSRHKSTIQLEQETLWGEPYGES